MNRNYFKKIYIEITNTCNLKCPFCTKSKRDKKNMSLEEFSIILKKIYPYTKYIYLHVLGEPLLHPNINEFINLAAKDFYVNITTNGYLINNIKDNKDIRQLNISLHSFSDIYNKSFDEYINDLFNYSDLNNDIYINYRLWSNTKYFDNFICKLEEKYNVKIDKNKINNTLKNNVFLNFKKEFIWPQVSNDKSFKGPCYALTDHIAILSDGTITACCLDVDGELSFGNIYTDSLENILKSFKFMKMKKELKNGIRCNELCKKCNFLE